MSWLIEFILPACLVSAAALGGLRAAERAPSSVRLAIASLGLMAWLVPWPMLHLPPAPASPLPLGGWVSETGTQVSSLKQDVASTIEAVAPIVAVPAFWWLVLFVPGLVWFAIDTIAFAGTVRDWRRRSRSGADLERLLSPGMGRLPRINVISDSSVAAATGWIRPTIWIGEQHLGDEAKLRVALLHELTHIQRRDPMWIMLITLIERLYWFNPLVPALGRQAALAIESACDDACARRLGRRHYRRALASLVLEGQESRDFVLAPLLRSTSLDLTRLALLEVRPRMDVRAWAAIVALIAASAGGAALAATVSADPRLGDWMEITDSSRHGYDVSPISRRYERLDNGMTRVYGSFSPDDATGFWTDLRCDGRDYPNRNSAGESNLTISCVAVDRSTNRYVTKWTDGSGRVAHATEIVSRDGETIALTVRHVIAGAATETTRTFSRMR